MKLGEGGLVGPVPGAPLLYASVLPNLTVVIWFFFKVIKLKGNSNLDFFVHEVYEGSP